MLDSSRPRYSQGTVVNGNQVTVAFYGMIPFSEMFCLLRHHYGIEDEDERERWIRMIKVIDSAYVTYANDTRRGR